MTDENISNGLVVEGDTQLRKRAWKDKFRDQLLQTPSKRQRRLLVEELLVTTRTTTTTESDVTLQQNNLPPLEENWWSEIELLEWLEELEQEDKDELVAMFHEEEEQDFSRRIEEYESSLEQMETDSVFCPLCFLGFLHQNLDDDDRTAIVCTCPQCSMRLETEMSVDEVRDKLRDTIDLHAEICSRPVVIKLSGDMLVVTCDVCETRLSII